MESTESEELSLGLTVSSEDLKRLDEGGYRLNHARNESTQRDEIKAKKDDVQLFQVSIDNLGHVKISLATMMDKETFLTESKTFLSSSGPGSLEEPDIDTQGDQVSLGFIGTDISCVLRKELEEISPDQEENMEIEIPNNAKFNRDIMAHQLVKFIEKARDDLPKAIVKMALIETERKVKSNSSAQKSP